ncbi:MAG: hypothetical protein JNM27_15520 [Leptospirales bacterium]|nr:hypothetical protein [Leptospirales bacterium]
MSKEDDQDLTELLSADWDALPEQLRDELLSSVVTTDAERAADWLQGSIHRKATRENPTPRRE